MDWSLRRSSVDDEYDFPEIAQKFHLKRFEVAIHKLTDIAIPFHLELLQKHKGNIEKFQRLSEWVKLEKEVINASRTVQQLKADIYEMDLIRNQIIDEDQNDFDGYISTIKEQTLKSVQEFGDLHAEVTKPVIHKNIDVMPDLIESDFIGNDQNEILERCYYQPLSEFVPPPASATNYSVSPDQDQVQVEKQAQLPPHNSKLTYSWLDLKKSLEDLNSMINNFSLQVYNQQPHIDSIENNVESSHVNVRSGVTNLSKAAKLKMAVGPVAGAVIGFGAGGPVGLFLGLKVGMAAALGASVVGYQAGKIIKSRQAKVTDLEMEKISPAMNRSTSLPEVKSETEINS